MIVNHKTLFCAQILLAFVRLAFVALWPVARAADVPAGSGAALWTGVFSLAKGVGSARKILDKIRKKTR